MAGATAATSPGATLLAPEVLARLERLQLGTRRKLAGRFSGEHRSLRHGTSLDFADVRDYHPGDDFRRIDYALFARTDQLFVRLFDAEDDVELRLVVDRSGSMGHGGKLLAAERLAAALGFVGLVRRDVVTLSTVPPEPGRAAGRRRFAGRHATAALFDSLAALQPAGDSDLGVAATHVLAQTGPPGITVLLSDLLSPTWTTAIERLPGRGADVAVVHVLSRDELDPDLLGDLELEDSETGERIAVSMTPEARQRYRSAVQSWLDTVTATCRRRGVAYSRVIADDLVGPGAHPHAVGDVVLRGWRGEGLVR